MVSMNDSHLNNRHTASWLSLCPLLAIARDWREAAVLAIGLLACTVVTAGTPAILQGTIQSALRLPLTALVAGTVAVLEHLALATWWPALDATVAPWLVLVAGLAVLVCMEQKPIHGSGSRPIPAPDDERTVVAFAFRARIALQLSAVLLIVGVARGGFGRVFLLVQTPVGALVLLALLLAGINFVMRGSMGAWQLPVSSPPDSGPRRNDGQHA